MTLFDGVKAAALLFVTAIAQVSVFSQLHVFGAVPDVLLVSLVGFALLRGSVGGAVGGFFAGLLVDTASLGTLGLTALVLTLSGYWIGRYGETTGRDRAHAPFLSVAVVTVLYQLGLLVTLVALALLRGSVVGAVGGFFAGLLVDTASLGTMGLTSLVLTLAGYWIGRYGETTGRDRAHAPFLSIAVVTVLYQLGLLVVHFVLGESAPAGAVMRSLLPAIVLNLILTAPLYALVRRLLRPVERDELTAEVQLLG
jgi:rod shape-determining protein MreD